ncbi:hypothetical protein [Persicobacter psychrovividus]|uniref:Site-specific DNA-methyltransferase (adenine-specific) n=1 Tax=Persicobacter psychrovividus TaxID=387638 RepID=A0ABM7VN81_9BACT|nr:hypothetical protein PEPS_47420 [Persicobacter psychrovividus]
MDKQGYISWMQSELRAGKKHNRNSIEKVARERFGIDQKNLVKELTEAAIVRRAHFLAFGARSFLERYEQITDLYKLQVNLSMRTSISIMMQQYSTPAPIAFLASSFIRVSKLKGKFFEPSAGNGLLTIALPPEQTDVNELDETRRYNLKMMNFRNVYALDASQDFGIEFIRYYDGVITNPPFGTLPDPVFFGDYKIKKLEHLMCLEALYCMKNDGRAALIIGSHTRYDERNRIRAGHDRIFFNYLYHYYHVVDVIAIDGKKLYSRQGTSFDTRLILIAGRKRKPEGAAPLKTDELATVMRSHDQLFNRIIPHMKSNEAIAKTKAKTRAKAIMILQKQLNL